MPYQVLREIYIFRVFSSKYRIFLWDEHMYSAQFHVLGYVLTNKRVGDITLFLTITCSYCWVCAWINLILDNKNVHVCFSKRTFIFYSSRQENGVI
jgi:hypothetical protein